MKRVFFILILAFSWISGQQTTEHLSSYLMTTLNYKYNQKWSAYLELQGRGLEKFTPMDYYEVKGGVGYNVNSKNQVLLGLGRYGTYKEAKISQEEFRIWAQYVLTQNFGALKVDHRIRIEKRFYTFPQISTHDQDERFRYRLLITLPLGKEKVAPDTFFVNAYDELFFTLDEPNFRRNRLFGGIGYQYNQFFNINLGYLWQREFTLKGNKNLHFLYTGFNFNIDRLKNHELHPPHPAD